MLNTQITLRSRPDGVPTVENFTTRTEEIRPLVGGEFLVRNQYLGLAPASRIRMTKGDSYAAPTPLDGVIYGQSIGEIVESRNSQFPEGQFACLTDGGWQKYSTSNGNSARLVRVNSFPLTWWLGALGVSGFTAYIGTLKIGAAREGETAVVSAASGAVGSIAGQIARIEGCKVIGIAGGEPKCRYAVDDLRFDACIDHRSEDLGAQLRAVSTEGVDLFFDNVGGAVRNAVIESMNLHARIAVCGMISEYNETQKGTGPSWMPILTKRLVVSGFMMRDHEDLRCEFESRMIDWLHEERIIVREEITDGFENTPRAFIAMLDGRNFGKSIVKI